jgi:hypothetical protein
MMTASAPAAAIACVTTAEGMTHTWTLIRRPGSASLVFNVIVIGSPSPVAAACFEHLVVLADFIGWWPIK